MFMYAENVSRSAGEGGDVFAAAEASCCIAPDTNTPPYVYWRGRPGSNRLTPAIAGPSYWAAPYSAGLSHSRRAGLSRLSIRRRAAIVPILHEAVRR